MVKDYWRLNVVFGIGRLKWSSIRWFETYRLSPQKYVIFFFTLTQPMGNVIKSLYRLGVDLMQQEGTSNPQYSIINILSTQLIQAIVQSHWSDLTVGWQIFLFCLLQMVFLEPTIWEWWDIKIQCAHPAQSVITQLHLDRKFVSYNLVCGRFCNFIFHGEKSDFEAWPHPPALIIQKAFDSFHHQCLKTEG